MSKYKATGCSRLLFFLAILIPIAYFGSRYLQNSGMLDGIKEKVEQEQKKSDFPELDNSSDDGLSPGERRKRELEMSEQERKIREQEERIRQLEEQVNNREPSATQNQPIERNRPSDRIPEPPSSNNSNGSLDELFEDFDRQTGGKYDTGTSSGGTGSSAPSTNSGDNRAEQIESLATWSFTFQSMRGTIEFFSRGDRIYKRVSDQGRNTDYELVKRDGRYYVVDSPTKEYYELRPNGDLDAFDQNGFQTTCKRVK